MHSERAILLVFAVFPVAFRVANAQFGGIGGAEDAISREAVRSKRPPVRILWSDPQDQLVHERLARTIHTDQKFFSPRDFAHFLETELEIPVRLDPPGLEEAGVDENTVIEVSSSKLPVRQFIDDALSSIHLSCLVKRGRLVITSQDACHEQLTTRIYNIRDLVSWPGQSTPAAKPRGLTPVPVPEGTRVYWPGSSHNVLQTTANETAYEIVDMLQSTVASDAWVENGGSGSATVYRGMLVISQTEELHHDIGVALDQLRQAEASQPGTVIVFP